MKNGRHESNGTVEYYKDDKLHRDDGPAIIDNDGYKIWYKHGVIHRLNGPAVEGPEGDKAYYVNGKLHNENGPALINKFGKEEWHIEGIRYTEQEFNAKTKLASIKCFGSDTTKQRANQQTKSIDR
ncbi:hypothetical protein F7R25_04010 [Burkholderia stagnalis]|uniref:MORN repeat-containing protein n=1 Tax=Burkholderia stagnalis TaxID=1503054 RepID=A0A6L3N3T2_9BURK|nr:hypothetical protein [Burkholderia stagnalis]KAB0640669.1 hypothetical protein F7R25_04010 [Burkholderia stagnalis]VWB06287.1 hypothetical protein BST28156_00112 [Burkholderia stagnalis]